jgi:uncharacterized protein (DUF4415 family)
VKANAADPRPEPRPDLGPEMRPSTRPLTDEDGEVCELTAEDFKGMRPLTEIDPGLIEAVAEYRCKRGRPKAETTIIHIGFRLAADVVEGVKPSGPGYNARRRTGAPQGRLRAALAKKPAPRPRREARPASEKARLMEERPRLTALEIEEQLIAELQRLPSLRDTQSLRIRPYSGPKGGHGSWTGSSRKWGRRRSSLSPWRPSPVSCGNNTTSISAPRRQPEVKGRDEHLSEAKQRALIRVSMGGFTHAVRGLRADLAEPP